MRQRLAIGLTLGLFSLAVGGCARQPEPRFTLSAASQKLKPEFQEKISKLLAERTGRPMAPKLIGTPNAAPAYLARGAEVYTRYCVQCHGVNGDGNGVAATYLVPRPRNYQLGIFKFTSTTYGSKPLRDDLLRTVKRGVRGTSMPAFPLLAPRDLEAVVDYVLALTHRGEFESKLAEQAEFDEQIDEAKVPEVMAEIATRWEDAKAHVVYPATPMPTFKKENIEAGKKAFESVGCSKCHGEDGRGMMASNVGTDAWGFPTKAADLTSGMLRGGTEPLDIYRHIDSGINGTPMPSFRDTLKTQPETVWNLVSYVFHVAEIRRDGAIPDSGVLEDGYLKPLPGVTVGGAPAAAAPAPAAAAGAPGEGRTGNAPDVASR